MFPVTVPLQTDQDWLRDVLALTAPLFSAGYLAFHAVIVNSRPGMPLLTQLHDSSANS